MKGNYLFLGLTKNEAHPHLLEHFTKGKVYQIVKPRSPYRTAINDLEQSIMISNTMLQQLFRKLNDK